MPWAGLPQVKAALPRMAVLAGIWAGLTGLLLAAGAVVIHSAAITHFDQHVTRMVVDSRTTPLNSAMKAVTWLGSWVAIVVAAVIIAVLVWTRRLPVLAFIVTVLAWADERAAYKSASMSWLAGGPRRPSAWFRLTAGRFLPAMPRWRAWRS